MSSKKNSPSRQALLLSLSNPRVCGEIFGRLIQSLRLRDGRPLERIAPLAGLTVPQWEEMEAGRAPDSWEQVRLITAVLFLSHSWIPYLEDLWGGARRDELLRDRPWLRNS